MKEEGLILPQSRLDGIKLVVCDMDGTALNDKKELSPETLRAFRKLQEAGIGLTIASARTPLMLGVYCAQAKLGDIPLISLEGASLTDIPTGRLLYSRPLGRCAEAIIRYCHDALLDYTIYTGKNCYLRRDTERMWRFVLYNESASRHGTAPVPTAVFEDTPMEQILSESVFKIFIDNPKGDDREKLMSFLSDYPELRTDCSEGISITIMDKDVSKANALTALCSQLGLDRTEVCCFGDWNNDVSMLAAFPHSVAMGNAIPEAKAAAAYITKTNTQDGVAYFINNYIL